MYAVPFLPSDELLTGWGEFSDSLNSAGAKATFFMCGKIYCYIYDYADVVEKCVCHVDILYCQFTTYNTTLFQGLQ